MRRQGINFGYARERGDERRTDTAARADKISVVVGFFHEPLSNHVQPREPVRDYRLKFLFQSGFDNRRKIFPVKLSRLRVGRFANFFFRARHLRRVRTVGYRL